MNAEIFILLIPILLIITGLIKVEQAVKSLISITLHLAAFVLSLVLLLGGPVGQYTIFSSGGAIPIALAGNKLTSALIALVSFIQLCFCIRISLDNSIEENSVDLLNPAAIIILYALVLSANLVTVFITSLIFTVLCLLISHRTGKSFSISKMALFLGISELILFSGVMILYFVNGSFEFGITKTAITNNTALGGLAIFGTILLVLAPAASSLLFPFNAWFIPASSRRSSSDITFILGLIVPSGIVLYLKTAPVFTLPAQITLVIIAFAGILYSLMQSFSAVSKNDFLKSSIMADSGLVVLSVAFGNYALAVFLFAVFTISRLLIARSAFNNKFSNPAVRYWFTLGSIIFYIGIPLTARFAGYSYLMGSANEFNALIPGAGIILPLSAFAMSFVSSFALVRFFFENQHENNLPGIKTAREEILSNADMLLLGASSLFFWYLTNPLNPAGIWFISLLVTDSSKVILQSNSENMNYVYSLIVYSSTGLGAFLGYLRAGKKKWATKPAVFNAFEGKIENLLAGFGHQVSSGSVEGKKSFGKEEIDKRFEGADFGFSVLFILLVLFYFIFRSM